MRRGGVRGGPSHILRGPPHGGDSGRGLVLCGVCDRQGRWGSAVRSCHGGRGTEPEPAWGIGRIAVCKCREGRGRLDRGCQGRGRISRTRCGSERIGKRADSRRGAARSGHCSGAERGASNRGKKRKGLGRGDGKAGWRPSDGRGARGKCIRGAGVPGSGPGIRVPCSRGNRRAWGNKRRGSCPKLPGRNGTAERKPWW